jgi:hypothetical protein
MSQTPPEPADLRFALSKFGEDAKRWDDNARVLGQAARSADALEIDALAFGPAAWLGVPEQYRLVQRMITDRLAEGERRLAEVAEALRTARDVYQREEDANVHRIKGIW